MAAYNDPVIITTHGIVRGIRRQTIYGAHYYRFEGIPYAKPPVGDLRFKAPVTADSWDGVRECFYFDVKPLQKNRVGEAEGSEDCLYLNIYSKSIGKGVKLPVMVWIYCNAFNTDSCIRYKYSPDYFMEQDVVIVTFNYRLSALGFLSVEDEKCEVPGNAGLKDQVLALKWVKRNIRNFGGDTENITLFGSDGAAVHYLSLTDQTKGLFHKIICMSGVALNPWAFRPNLTRLPYRVAYSKGYRGPNEDEAVLKYLRTLFPQQLVLNDKLNAEAFNRGELFAFVPCIEPYDNEGSVIRSDPAELMSSSWANDIPMMIGGNSFEGLAKFLLLTKRPLYDIYRKDPKQYLPRKMRDNITRKKLIELSRDIRKMHFANNSEIMGFMFYDTYTSYWEGIHRVVRARLKFSKAPTYQYIFDYDSPHFNHHRTIYSANNVDIGVCHGDILSYLFLSFYVKKLETNSADYLMLQRMIEIWTSFAKTSDPNCESIQPVSWKSIDSIENGIYKWLRISEKITFEEMPEDIINKLNFWVDLNEN